MDFSTLLPLFFELVRELVQIILVIAVGFAINFIRLKISEEKLIVIEKIVKDGVLFAQQVYKNLDGEEKYEKAVQQIVAVLNTKGLSVDDDQLKLFIESALKQLKKEFGEQWNS